MDSQSLLRRQCLLLATVLLGFAAISRADDRGAITYDFTLQGLVNYQNEPANGRFDVLLRVCTSEMCPEGTELTRGFACDVMIIDGRLLVTVDAPEDVFANDEPRFIQPNLREHFIDCNQNFDSFDHLTPMLVTYAPRAIWAPRSGTSNISLVAGRAGTLELPAELVGTLAAPILTIQQLGAGPALNVLGSSTFSGLVGFTADPPFSVASTTLIPNLNATLLNGRTESFLRDASNLASGTLPNARLSGTYSSALTLSNASNSFSGAGSGLTALNAGNISTGTIADARLTANVALLAGSQTFTGAKTFNNASNSFSGSGAGLTALNAGNISTGTVADARLTSNVALLANTQTFTGAKTFSLNSSSTTPQIRLLEMAEDSARLMFANTVNTGRNWQIHGFIGSQPVEFPDDYFDFYHSAGGITMTIARSGGNARVGILAAVPGYTLEVNGTAGKPGGGSWSNSSDVRLKKDIHPLAGSLERLLRLRGVTFQYIEPEAIRELPGTRIGMVAQEVEQVFPDWVDEGQNGMKRVTYRGFEALAVEALRDLRSEKDRQVAALQAENECLRATMQELEAKLARIEGLLTDRTLVHAARADVTANAE